MPNWSVKDALARWADFESEFRQFTTRRYDTLKSVNSGNGAGFLAVAVFLSTGTRNARQIFYAKTCLCMFFIGIASYVIALVAFTLTEDSMESAIAEYRKNNNIESDQLKLILKDCRQLSVVASFGLITSFMFFAIASFSTFAACLLFL